MTPAGIEPATFRFVAQHLNHSATAVPTYHKVKGEKPGDLKIDKAGLLRIHGTVDRIVPPRYLVCKQLNTMECDAAGSPRYS